MEGVGGSLQKPAKCEGLINEEVWALMSEERRRLLIGVLHRTEADEVKRPLGVPDGTLLLDPCCSACINFFIC